MLRPSILEVTSGSRAVSDRFATALMAEFRRAIKRGDAEAVRAMLAAEPGRASLPIEETTGATPLHLAALCGRDAVVRALIARAGADDVNRVDRAGRTALVHACAAGHAACARALLGAPGVDVNLPTRQGDTALMCAAEKGHLDVIELLAVPGTDVRRRNRGGRTALELAVGEGHDAAAAALDAAERQLDEISDDERDGGAAPRAERDDEDDEDDDEEEDDELEASRPPLPSTAPASLGGLGASRGGARASASRPPVLPAVPPAGGGASPAGFIMMDSNAALGL